MWKANFGAMEDDVFVVKGDLKTFIEKDKICDFGLFHNTNTIEN